MDVKKLVHNLDPNLYQEFNKLVDLVYAQKIRAMAPLEATETSGGTTLALVGDATPTKYLNVGSNDAGSPPAHAWQEVISNAQGSTKSPGIWSGSTTSTPLYEIN